jgi:hypothetical protein
VSTTESFRIRVYGCTGKFFQEVSVCRLGVCLQMHLVEARRIGKRRTWCIADLRDGRWLTIMVHQNRLLVEGVLNWVETLRRMITTRRAPKIKSRELPRALSPEDPPLRTNVGGELTGG